MRSGSIASMPSRVRCPGCRGQPAGQDRLDVAWRDIVRRRPAPERTRTKEPRRQRIFADLGARPASPLIVSRPIARSGGAQLDPRQLGGPCREGLEPELQPRFGWARRRPRRRRPRNPGSWPCRSRRRPRASRTAGPAARALTSRSGTDLARTVHAHGQWARSRPSPRSSGRSRRAAMTSMCAVSAGTTERTRDRPRVVRTTRRRAESRPSS